MQEVIDRETRKILAVDRGIKEDYQWCLVDLPTLFIDGNVIRSSGTSEKNNHEDSHG